MLLTILQWFFGLSIGFVVVAYLIRAVLRVIQKAKNKKYETDGAEYDKD